MIVLLAIQSSDSMEDYLQPVLVGKSANNRPFNSVGHLGFPLVLAQGLVYYRLGPFMPSSGGWGKENSHARHPMKILGILTPSWAEEEGEVLWRVFTLQHKASHRVQWIRLEALISIRWDPNSVPLCKAFRPWIFVCFFGPIAKSVLTQFYDVMVPQAFPTAGRLSQPARK